MGIRIGKRNVARHPHRTSFAVPIGSRIGHRPTTSRDPRFSTSSQDPHTLPPQSTLLDARSRRRRRSDRLAAVDAAREEARCGEQAERRLR
eukprot:6902732-Prymnesium_polylepis.1